MAAVHENRIASPLAGIFVAGIAAALVVGGTGGYVARGLTLRTSGPAAAAEHGQVRAAAQLPAWVQRYMAPATAQAPQVKVDDLIRSLDQTQMGAAGAPSPPSWVQRYLTPAGATRFKVDEYIAGLGAAATPVGSSGIRCVRLQGGHKGC